MAWLFMGFCALPHFPCVSDLPTQFSRSVQLINRWKVSDNDFYTLAFSCYCKKKQLLTTPLKSGICAILCHMVHFYISAYISKPTPLTYPHPHTRTHTHTQNLQSHLARPNLPLTVILTYLHASISELLSNYYVNQSNS